MKNTRKVYLWVIETRSLHGIERDLYSSREEARKVIKELKNMFGHDYYAKMAKYVRV